MNTRAVALALFLTMAAASTALAVTTRVWRLTSYHDFDEGEATGVLLSSLGEATSGFGATRIDMNEAAAFCAVHAPDGTTWFGTGDQGAVYAVRKGKAQLVAKLDGAVLASALAVAADGTVFAGTIPGGKVFKIGKDGKAALVAQLDADHVWALVYDDAKKTLYAGTGPAGKLFAIDPNGGAKQKPQLIFDSGEKHLLALERGEGGEIYAGSGDQAILYRIKPGKGAVALHDFEGDEVRAIVRHGTSLYVAVNEFQKSGLTLSPSGPSPPPKGTKIVLPSAAPAPPPAAPGRDRKGKGAVYRVDADGRVEQLHALADGYFTALAVDADGSVWAASGSGGRVYLIRPDRTVLTAIDLAERQVLSLAFGGGERLLGTGDAGGIYRLEPGAPKDARYLSRVFDAQFPSKWGSVSWSGGGTLVVETRSGNTGRPDKTWSDWQAPSSAQKRPTGGGGHVASPDGRYLQVRVGFGGAQSVLRDLSVYYVPQNQRARLTEVATGDETPRKNQLRSGRPHSALVHVRWKVDNPDEDELVYRLSFREDSEANWRPLGGPEPLTRTEYDWNTESVPDGNYVVRVVASDERANPREQALDHSLVSAPFLVDNRKPELLDLKVAYPYLSGRARDSFSAITELAFSVDGGDWQNAAPRDGIFDQPDEDFSIKLPASLSSGAHSVAVRAADAADNVGAAQVAFRVK